VVLFFYGTVFMGLFLECCRQLMAERVWAIMKATDSRECRSCHSQARMDLESQGKQAHRKHRPERMASRGETCIDCHQGIAHELPD
tara:strand:+ start:276 stop:533 length:258 start_codon:yes stop_codon:yes gene_type:complete